MGPGSSCEFASCTDLTTPSQFGLFAPIGAILPLLAASIAHLRISLSGSIQYNVKYEIVFSDVDRTLCCGVILGNPDLVLTNRETQGHRRLAFRLTIHRECRAWRGGD